MHEIFQQYQLQINKNETCVLTEELELRDKKSYY